MSEILGLAKNLVEMRTNICVIRRLFNRLGKQFLCLLDITAFKQEPGIRIGNLCILRCDFIRCLAGGQRFTEVSVPINPGQIVVYHRKACGLMCAFLTIAKEARMDLSEAEIQVLASLVKANIEGEATDRSSLEAKAE